VRDPALTAVAHGLDDGHADVPCGVFDRIDYCLYAVAKNDRFYLHQRVLLSR
jgi:hypothetical protein